MSLTLITIKSVIFSERQGILDLSTVTKKNNVNKIFMPCKRNTNKKLSSSWETRDWPKHILNHQLPIMLWQHENQVVAPWNLKSRYWNLRKSYLFWDLALIRLSWKVSIDGHLQQYIFLDEMHLKEKQDKKNEEDSFIAYCVRFSDLLPQQYKSHGLFILVSVIYMCSYKKKLI